MTNAVELITIGDELLLGFTIDTNSAALGRALAARGVAIVRRTSVGDDLDGIAHALFDPHGHSGQSQPAGIDHLHDGLDGLARGGNGKDENEQDGESRNHGPLRKGADPRQAGDSMVGRPFRQVNVAFCRTGPRVTAGRAARAGGLRSTGTEGARQVIF